MRLDQLLLAQGHYATRARARDAVLRGTVTVNGIVAEKPGQAVSADAEITLADAARTYVSRAALKLIHGLDFFRIPVAGRIGLDIGASTGGFSEVLLERGARKVYAVDVGEGQLSAKIAGNPRIVSLEKLNARDLEPCHVPDRPDLVVCDVSFVSLTRILDPALNLAGRNAHLLVLIKPQFEAGRAGVGRSGIVRDPAVHARVCDNIKDWLISKGEWRLLGTTPSPIPGGEGNSEFLLAAEKAE